MEYPISRWKMAKHEGLSVILTLILTASAIVTLIMSFIPFPWKFPALIVTVIIFILFVLLYFHFYAKKHEEQAKAFLEIRILPFYKGFPIPPSPAEKILNADGSITYRGRNDSRTTTEQVQFLAPSQLLAVWYGKLDEEKKEFVAKFGVLRIRSIIGVIKECHVDAKYRVIREMEVTRESKWCNGGYLNWFSPMIKQSMAKYNLLEKIYNGINEYLKNETVDIYQGEERDLLLFYVVKGSPKIHLCSGLEYCEIGIATDENMPLRFELELMVAGENFPSVIKRFKISAVWDDFGIKEVP